MKKRVNIAAIALFYLVAITLRYIAVKTDLLSPIENAYLQILLRGVGPALGALAAVAIFKIPLNISLKGIYEHAVLPFAVYWLLPAFLISTVYFYIDGSFPILLMFTVLVYGLLEEIGWRVFLQEQLKPLPKFYSILIIVVLWFAWHLNFELSSGNLLFLGILFFGTWGIGKVYDKTRSLLAIAGVHSLNNFFIHGIHQTELILILALLVIWIAFIIRYKS